MQVAMSFRGLALGFRSLELANHGEADEDNRPHPSLLHSPCHALCLPHSLSLTVSPLLSLPPSPSVSTWRFMRSYKWFYKSPRKLISIATLLVTLLITLPMNLRLYPSFSLFFFPPPPAFKVHPSTLRSILDLSPPLGSKEASGAAEPRAFRRVFRGLGPLNFFGGLKAS